MIVFCEECGAKNIITEAFLSGRGVVAFPCSECGYRNRYVLHPPPSTQTNNLLQMQQIARSARSIDGVIGVFFYQSDETIPFSDMPVSLKTDDLKMLGSLFIKDWLRFEQIAQISHIHLAIPQRHALVQKISQHVYCIIICRNWSTSEKVRFQPKIESNNPLKCRRCKTKKSVQFSYFISEKNGRILETTFQPSKIIKNVVINCFDGSLKIAPDGYHFLCAAFTHQPDLFIFPVGNRILAMLKKEDIPFDIFVTRVNDLILKKYKTIPTANR